MRRIQLLYCLIAKLLKRKKQSNNSTIQQFAWLHRRSGLKPAISLIEMMVVIALVGILASAVMLALKPGKRTAAARDAIRKKDIVEISKILDIYKFKYGTLPSETGHCDASIGDDIVRCDDLITIPCSGNPPHNCYLGRWDDEDIPNEYWNTDILVHLRNKKLVKNLPLDPINNQMYYYQYEPRVSNGTLCAFNEPDCIYWVGARLEDVPADQKGRVAFRCSDYPPNKLGKEGPGCKVVEYDNAAWIPPDSNHENNFSRKPWCEKNQSESCD